MKLQLMWTKVLYDRLIVNSCHSYYPLYCSGTRTLEGRITDGASGRVAKLISMHLTSLVLRNVFCIVQKTLSITVSEYRSSCALIWVIASF